MRYLIASVATAFLAGCATVDYQPYEGRNNIYNGEGGARAVVDGVDLWTLGAPARKYSIIALVTGDASGGLSDESTIRSAVVGEIKKRGGDAAIQITSNRGIILAMPDIYRASNRKGLLFAVIKYVQ